MVYKFSELKRISKTSQLMPLESNSSAKLLGNSTDKLKSPSQINNKAVIQICGYFLI